MVKYGRKKQQIPTPTIPTSSGGNKPVKICPTTWDPIQHGLFHGA